MKKLTGMGLDRLGGTKSIMFEGRFFSTSQLNLFVEKRFEIRDNKLVAKNKGASYLKSFTGILKISNKAHTSYLEFSKGVFIKEVDENSYKALYPEYKLLNWQDDNTATTRNGKFKVITVEYPIDGRVGQIAYKTYFKENEIFNKGFYATLELAKNNCQKLYNSIQKEKLNKKK